MCTLSARWRGHEVLGAAGLKNGDRHNDYYENGHNNDYGDRHDGMTAGLNRIETFCLRYP
jgi:hypothetical protein